MGVEDTYDAIADVYAERFTDELDRKPFDRDLLDSLVPRFDAGLVADIGCGPGQIGRYLFDRGVDVIGVDLSAAMVRVARDRNPGMRFEKADMRVLPFADDELAGAVAFYSLIHLTPEDAAAACAELHRVIAPGGVLCVAVHMREDGEVVHLEEWFDRPVDIDARFWSVDDALGALAGHFRVDWMHVREPYEEERTTRLYFTAISR